MLKPCFQQQPLQLYHQIRGPLHLLTIRAPIRHRKAHSTSTRASSPGYILPSSAQAHCSYTATSTLYSSFCPSPSIPSSPFLASPTEQQESLPSVQPFTLSQQTPGPVKVAIPGSIPSSSSNEAVRTQTRKQCIVVGCQELIAPTMWRSHMTLHAKGIFPGAIPNFWLDVYCCAPCHQLVANSRSSSHSQRCKGRALATSNPVDTPSLVPCSQSEPNPNLPSFEVVCQLTLPTLRFVPKKSRPSFARVLSATMRQVLMENSEQAWLKLFMLPKCVLPSRKRRGCHDVPTSVDFLCSLRSKNEFGTLWNLAKNKQMENRQPHGQAAKHN